MITKNPYKKDAKIDNKITLKILKNFCMDFSATDTSKLLKIRRSTINLWYNYFRQVIFEYETNIEHEVMSGIIELDESGKVSVDALINTDGWHSYDGLVDLGYKKHYRVNHGNNEFARGKQHINGIESFRGYCKRRLVKFNGVSKEKFALHLKECEFRFNCGLGKEDVYAKCKKILKQYVKNF